MKKLPVGKSTFRDIRNPDDNYAYVDKTMFAHRMINSGFYYFLSRPRRFGKSLFLDTLSEIFSGNKALFEGLYIYDKWDWTKSYPVINISFGSGRFTSPEDIYNKTAYLINQNRRILGLAEVAEDKDLSILLSELIFDTYKKYDQQVVILIDEYDKPILDNITHVEEASIAHDILRNVYGSIKDNDQYLKFVFLTGVSKFSKLNLFSGLNNIEDITIDKNYADIAGYTQHDLETVFAEHLLEADKGAVKKWYNGYNYLGEPLYNPYDILLFISKGGVFRNYWWETGNPAFLVKVLKEGHYFLPNLENIIVEETTLNSFDINTMDLAALLWQTGYLTFAEKVESSGLPVYKMKVPNKEVQISLNRLFNDCLTGIKNERLVKEISLSKALREKAFDKFHTTLQSLFSAIPYNNYVKNNIAQFEGYYASVMFATLSSLGTDIIAEDTTNTGRADMTLLTDDSIFIFEFKVDMPDEGTLMQIHKKKYYNKYLESGKDIYLIGINFDSRKRNISQFEIEEYINK